MRGPRFYLALWVSKVIATGIDLVAKGRGTNLPGAVALKIDPGFLSHLRGIDPEKTVFITGTNGKSTVTNLLTRTLTEAGHRVVSNLDGANMMAGVAVPLLRSCSLFGKLRCDYVVLETDERYVALIQKHIPAKYLCLTNIQKDQVQRNGEPSFIFEKIKKAVNPELTLFLNQDEPNSLCLRDSGAKRVIPYGIAPHERSFRKEDDFFAVSMPCPKCHSGIRFEQYNLDNIGQFHCPVCGFSNDQNTKYITRNVSFEEKRFEINGKILPFHCNLPEFLYSYTLAAAVAMELGVAFDVIERAFDGFRGLKSRRADHPVGGKTVKFYKMKQENAEALQSIINSISEDPQKKVVMFSCEEYIFAFPPYLNIGFMFDCDFRGLRDSNVDRWVCISKATSHLSALRFLYDGFDLTKADFLPNSSEAEMTKLLQTLDCDNIYLMEEFPFWIA